MGRKEDSQGCRHGVAGRCTGTGWRMARSSVGRGRDRKSTRLNSSHLVISYAVFCLKKKKLGAHVPFAGIDGGVPARPLQQLPRVLRSTAILQKLHAHRSAAPQCLDPEPSMTTAFS